MLKADLYGKYDFKAAVALVRQMLDGDGARP